MIYFIQSSSGAIKIGYTKRSAKSRLAGLQTNTAETLTLIGTVPGDLRTEEAIHRRFANQIIRGEWFKSTPELLGFIRINSIDEIRCRATSESDQFELSIGQSIKKLRLNQAIHLDTLATEAGVSVSALRHLEAGSGASVKTLVRVATALKKQDWLIGLAPTISVNPLHMVRGKPRQRAKRRQKSS